MRWCSAGVTRPQLLMCAVATVMAGVSGATPGTVAPHSSLRATAAGDWLLIVHPMLTSGPALPVTTFSRLSATYVALWDGRTNTNVCLLDQARSTNGMGTASLNIENLQPTTGSCASEVAVFSSNAAMFLRVSPSWGFGLSDVQVAWLTPPLQNRVNVWVQEGDSDGMVKATSEFFATRNLLDKNRMGVITSGTIRDTSVNLGTTGSGASGGAGCHNLGIITAYGQPIYEPDKVNVYFVPKVVRYLAPINTYVEKAGENCRDVNAPNVMFISLSMYLPTTMVHEIGHAFSLYHINDGTLLEPGFTPENLMYDGDTPTITAPRNVLSLGQVYRANVNTTSWVNIDPDGAPGGPTPMRAPPTKVCQDNFVNPGPCPRQNQPWP